MQWAVWTTTFRKNKIYWRILLCISSCRPFNRPCILDKKYILTKSSTDVISSHHLRSHQIKMNLVTAGLRVITMVDMQSLQYHREYCHCLAANCPSLTGLHYTQLEYTTVNTTVNTNTMLYSSTIFSIILVRLRQNRVGDWYLLTFIAKLC